MKKLLAKGISTILLVALILTMISGIALADTVIASDGKSYIRSEPNKGGAILGTLHKGEQAMFLDEIVTDYRGIDWYYISFNGKTGWISSRYTDILTSQSSWDWDYDDYDFYNGRGSSYGCTGGYDYSDRYVIAANGKTYIRSAPSTSAEDLSCLPQGAYATYLEEYSIDRNGRYWYKVKYSGITGWVSARYTIVQ